MRSLHRVKQQNEAIKVQEAARKAKVDAARR